MMLYQNRDFQITQDQSILMWTMKLEGGQNHLNQRFAESFEESFEALCELIGPTTKAVVLQSGWDHFCVGADLSIFEDELQVDKIDGLLNRLHHQMRKLEQLKIPVISWIEGNALGGGYELCLATHLRVVVSPIAQMESFRIGLPETQLGLIPGAGGTQRLTRLLGTQSALEILSQGKTLTPLKALKQGLVDRVFQSKQEAWMDLLQWINQNPNPKQPWDQKNALLPGIQPQSAQERQLFLGSSAFLAQKTTLAYDHLNLLVQCVQESIHLPIDQGLKVEARTFKQILLKTAAYQMIQTLWFHKRRVEKLAYYQDLLSSMDMAESATESPTRSTTHPIKTIGILGAGMMGASLAFVCAQAQYHVIIRDIKTETLTNAQKHIKQLASQSKLNASQQDSIDAIEFTTSIKPFKEADLIIEAVFEDLDLKHRVIRECESQLKNTAIFASNTSALPITDLSQASVRPQNMIGLHFFSPVEKMPLLEIILAKQTSAQTLRQSLDFCASIKKTPIVVNDGYGFFTTRVFAAYILEGATLVAQGYDPTMIEWCAKRIGMAMPPLKIFDEVSLKLGLHSIEMREKYGLAVSFEAGIALLKAMIAEGRFGKACGLGFYDYQQKPSIIDPNLQSFVDQLDYPKTEFKREKLNLLSTTQIKQLQKEIQDRLCIIQAIEATKALQEGVVRSKMDGNLASILGIGFAANTGGIFAWIDRQDKRDLIERCEHLAQTQGSRFDVPQSWVIT